MRVEGKRAKHGCFRLRRQRLGELPSTSPGPSVDDADHIMHAEEYNSNTVLLYLIPKNGIIGFRRLHHSPEHRAIQKPVQRDAEWLRSSCS